MTSPTSLQNIAKPFQVGKIKFEKGDTMVVRVSRSLVCAEDLARLVDGLPKSYPGVRIVFIPEGVDITRLRFESNGKVLEPIHLTDGILKLGEKADA